MDDPLYFCFTGCLVNIQGTLHGDRHGGRPIQYLVFSIGGGQVQHRVDTLKRRADGSGVNDVRLEMWNCLYGAAAESTELVTCHPVGK